MEETIKKPVAPSPVEKTWREKVANEAWEGCQKREHPTPAGGQFIALENEKNNQTAFLILNPPGSEGKKSAVFWRNQEESGALMQVYQEGFEVFVLYSNGNKSSLLQASAIFIGRGESLPYQNGLKNLKMRLRPQMFSSLNIQEHISVQDLEKEFRSYEKECLRQQGNQTEHF